MKKILFPAMLAIVAVGGSALSVNASFYHFDSPMGPAFSCDISGASCISTIGFRAVYDQSGNQVTDFYPFEDKQLEAL